MPHHASYALAPILAAALAVPALAQEQPPPAAQSATAQEGVISYSPADFAAARPNTALDMINRLPGFTLDQGDSAVRGFAGAGGNVLIDGQRPTIKTDTLNDTLGRITIDQVERIDLIRGGAPGIDMQGRTVIANVIRKKADTFQQVFDVRAFIFAQTGDTIPGWNYQATRRSGDHQFDVQLARGVSYDDSVGFAERTTLTVATGDLLTERVENEAEGPVHSLRANYKGPVFGGTFSVNSLISTDEFKDEAFIYSATTSERFTDRSANDRGELGLNYIHPLGEKWEIEALTLNKITYGSGDSSGNTGSSTSVVRVDAEAGESIGRGILRYAHSPSLQFEAGGEAAFNYRDQQVSLTVNGAPQTLPAADVQVEEERAEAFAQGTWRPSPQWSLEAGMRFERSTITQKGNNPLERSFDYPKPRVVATWSPTEDDQIRLRAERKVGQLNFRDFSSAVTLSSGVVTTANTDLRPDQRWTYEAAYEKRFWENGAAVVTVRHEDIEDVIDLRPFQISPTLIIFGPGNIGDGTNDEVELNLTLPLANFGLEGGELKANGLWRVSEVTDPSTGETRRISGQRPDVINVNFRQDLPAQKLTFGLGWFAGWEEDYYRERDLQSLRLSHFYSSFLEWKPTPSFTLRAELNNFDPYRFRIERFIFDAPRYGSAAVLTEIERERRKSQMIGMLRARWTFG